MEEIEKGLEAVSAPIKELIRVTAAGVGVVYKPKQIIKLGRATRDAAGNVSAAIRENPDIDLEVTFTSESGIEVRAKRRAEFQEVIKQENIESIVRKTLEELQGKERENDVSVENDWILRFFNSVETVSDETVQRLWSKILAGEISKPKSFSFLTLDCLSKMSKSDLDLLYTLSKYLIYSQRHYFLPNSKVLKSHISTESLLYLDELGILKANSPCAFEFTSKAICHNKNYLLCAKNDEKITLQIHPLTIVGKQLLQLVPYVSEERYFIDVCKELKKTYNGVGLYKIKNISNDIITFDMFNYLPAV